MIIGLIGVIILTVLFNTVYYEYRVVKGLFKEPKYITGSYAKLVLHRRYK
jgi:hypothetical protein